MLVHNRWPEWNFTWLHLLSITWEKHFWKRRTSFDFFPSSSDCGHVDRCWYHVREWLCIIFIRDDPLVWACRPQVKLQNNNKLSFNFTFLGQVIFLCLMDNFKLSPRRQVKPTSSSSTPFFSSSPHYQHPQFYRPTNLKVSELLGCEPILHISKTCPIQNKKLVQKAKPISS